VLFVCSNGMDVTLADTSITYKVLGGIIDLYVFTGPNPQAVVSQYTALVGRPSMMPYWSLGYRKFCRVLVAWVSLMAFLCMNIDNCKYGYTSLSQVKEVVANYSAANIPLDTQWMDIDYMLAYKDFTTDPTNFPTADVKSFVDGLHANGQHFVPIVDPGIKVESGYDAYEQGLKDDIFVKDIQGNNFLGQVWPGPTYFPDFFNPKTQVCMRLCHIFAFLCVTGVFFVHDRVTGPRNCKASTTWSATTVCGST
jgi:alpha-glucosidase (family GH31 glycosyl hydrolase)